MPSLQTKHHTYSSTYRFHVFLPQDCNIFTVSYKLRHFALETIIIFIIILLRIINGKPFYTKLIFIEWKQLLHTIKKLFWVPVRCTNTAHIFTFLGTIQIWTDLFWIVFSKNSKNNICILCSQPNSSLFYL